jgi:DNA-binding XRE family transcriptional regulator
MSSPKPRRGKTEHELRDAESKIMQLKQELEHCEGLPAARNLVANWLKLQEQKAAKRRQELERADVFARRLRRFREERRLTQAELARRSGVGQAMISLLEKGDRQPGWGTIRKLAEALVVGVEEFQ